MPGHTLRLNPHDANQTATWPRLKSTPAIASDFFFANETRHPVIDNYEIDEFGVIHQIEFEPITYDKEYISYYEDQHQAAFGRPMHGEEVSHR